MDCSNCGSPSAKFYTREGSGKEQRVCLCEECYKKLYPDSDASEVFARLFGNAGAKTKKSKTCPSCGMTLASFRKTGLAGCADCYAAFRSEIYESVRYCQWDIRHRGKAPSGGAEEKYDLVREQELVKSQFDAAMSEKNYRLAEQLKRRLQEIHGKIGRTELLRERKEIQAQIDAAVSERDYSLAERLDARLKEIDEKIAWAEE